MGFLKGKKALVIGLASNRSIAWGIAKSLKHHGAELAFNYQGEKLENRVRNMAQELGSEIAFPMDVTEDSQIDSFFNKLSNHWNSFDILIHCVAYAPADQLDGRYIEAVDRKGFLMAHDISSYSFSALAKKAKPMIENRNASLLTLSYLGAIRALPSYNVMGLAKASLEASTRFLAFDLGKEGIRVNAISAGPIKTLASAGIKGMRKMLEVAKNQSPLDKNVTIEEVGSAASFLCSDLASGITGQILYVDAGYNIVGMKSD